MTNHSNEEWLDWFRPYSKNSSLEKFFITFIIISFSSLSIIAQSIHTSQAIKVGGISQWIKMDGANEKNPVLLFFHGGPGNSVISYADKFMDQIQKHFVVVLWDQRETGETKTLNASSTTLTVDLFESDAVEVINYLRQRFNQDKIYLAGHSWGGFLALQVASHHANLLAGCYAAAPMVHQVESERISLQKMKTIALQEKNEVAMRELNSIQIPFESGEQLYFHRRWLSELVNKQKAPFKKGYVENWSKTWLNLFNEASQIDFATEAPEMNCPIYILIGSKDYQTNFEITKKYFEQLKAPKKELFWFTNSAHLLNLTESKKFQEVIISTLPKP